MLNGGLPHRSDIIRPPRPPASSPVTILDKGPTILDLEPSSDSPVVITQPLYDRKVKVDGILKMTVKVKSLKPFDVQWFKDDQELAMESKTLAYVALAAVNLVYKNV